MNERKKVWWQIRNLPNLINSPKSIQRQKNKALRNNLSKIEIYNLYWSQKLSVEKISKLFDCSPQLIFDFMENNNILRRKSYDYPITKKQLEALERGRQPRPNSGYSKTCKYCNKQFRTSYKNRIFCNGICYTKWKKGHKLSPILKGVTFEEYYGKEIAEIIKSKISKKLKGRIITENCKKILVKRMKENNPMKNIEIKKKSVKNHNYKESAKKISRTNNLMGNYKKTSKRMRSDNPMKNPFSIEKMSLTKKRLFKEGKLISPFQNEEVRRKAIKSLYQKPNKPETILINLFKENNLPYIYNGNKADLIIGGKIPDFYNNNGGKRVLELFGRQFHDPNNTFLKEIPYNRTEKGTLEHYHKLHFDCLIVWEEELRDMDKVLEKIILFEKNY